MVDIASLFLGCRFLEGGVFFFIYNQTKDKEDNK
jgi:hypothetical protein